MTPSAIVLLVALAALAWITWQDRAQFAAFKLYTATEDRQRLYRLWLVESLAFFAAGSLAALAIIGQIGATVREPEAFQPLSAAIRAGLPSHIRTEFAVGIAIGAGVSLIVGLIAARRGGRGGVIQLGDIGPLIPRNGAEMTLAGLLSLAAGLGEELFFRLLLPLLLVQLGAPPLPAFILATVVFGLAHLYQGWVGILATAVIGAALAALYLGSGALWLAMAVHAAFDLFGLVIRPGLTRLASARSAS
ncbi:MAG: CPBP family intramembrane glutamic endopeptidase [Caulobacteraceae bacterium]|jgi:membrane protease YdiL (CAAX protease family)